MSEIEPFSFLLERKHNPNDENEERTKKKAICIKREYGEEERAQPNGSGDDVKSENGTKRPFFSLTVWYRASNHRPAIKHYKQQTVLEPAERREGGAAPRPRPRVVRYRNSGRNDSFISGNFIIDRSNGDRIRFCITVLTDRTVPVHIIHCDNTALSQKLQTQLIVRIISGFVCINKT